MRNEDLATMHPQPSGEDDHDVVNPDKMKVSVDPQTTSTIPPLVQAATLPSSVDEPSAPFVYALGEIEFRFPTLGLEKEFAQVIGRTAEDGVNDRAALRAAISDDQNRYLARGLCWIHLIEGLETYILVPRDPADYRLLIDAVREYPRRDNIDVIIGTRTHIAPPGMCNGLAVPIVVFDQIYSFDRESLIEAIPAPDSLNSPDQIARFRQTAAGVVDHIMRMADNAGSTDEHRALNYLAVRYPKIYATVAEGQDRNESLAGIEARQSPLSGARRIIDVIFSLRNRQTDVTVKHLVRVDVTDLHPFLMRPLSPYYDLS